MYNPYPYSVVPQNANPLAPMPQYDVTPEQMMFQQLSRQYPNMSQDRLLQMAQRQVALQQQRAQFLDRKNLGPYGQRPTNQNPYTSNPGQNPYTQPSYVTPPGQGILPPMQRPQPPMQPMSMSGQQARPSYVTPQGRGIPQPMPSYNNPGVQRAAWQAQPTALTPYQTQMQKGMLQY